MARASVRTMLPLDRFARVLNINPLHFNQVEVAGLTTSPYCDQPMLQYSYQRADRVGREEIAEAIAQAEERMSSALGYKPVPQWEADERIPIGTLGVIAELNWGYYIAGGFPRLDTVELGADITYSDANMDGYDETATVTVAVPAGTTVDEVAAFYPGQSGDEAWEIRPIRVTLNGAGTQATIVMRREQLVLPELMEGWGTLVDPQIRVVEGTVDANFLTEVDVYRRVHDTSRQAHILWESGLCDCLDSGCEVCGSNLQTACMVARDHRNSVVSLRAATWDAAASPPAYSAAVVCGWGARWGTMRGRMWYRAGWQDTHLAAPLVQMDPQWERAISYYAVALLDRPLCGCEPLSSISSYWREDLSQNTSTQAQASTFQLDRTLLGNPFGTTRGALWAWRMVRSRSIGNLGH